MRLLLKHESRYRYPEPAALGPQVFRLRPANHAKAKIETYALRIEPAGELRWQQDPQGNHVARITFREGSRVDHFAVSVELAVEIRPVNPFDFYVDDRGKYAPFEYPAEMHRDLAPFLVKDTSGGEKLDAFLAKLPKGGETVPLIIELNRSVNQAVRYVIREEAGIFTPEQTLLEGRGSCRDSAVLLIAALRSRGLAARFVSGYLVQLTDEGMIPDEPRGIGRDVIDLHAWAEVFLPGAGWIGLDATSGLLAGEGHIPLACTSNPALAAPIDGTSDVAACETTFDMRVVRLGHEPRPTKPYEEEVWEDLLARGDDGDRRLAAAGVVLTMGGEPTFTARDNSSLPEWNGDALGAHKWKVGKRLANELKHRLAPGAALLHRAGKLYPGESLPRWALEIIGLRDGSKLVRDAKPGELKASVAVDVAHRFVDKLAARLGVEPSALPAFEDPWRFLQEEANLPVDVDPHVAKLSDPEERRRLANVLDRGVATEVGFALPLACVEGRWKTDRWTFRRKRLYLVPGDSPMGLRLPLRSLGEMDVVVPAEPKLAEPDPRVEDKDKVQRKTAAATTPKPKPPKRVGTALCVEPRGESLFVFLPPVESADDFVTLVRAVDAVRFELGVEVVFEGYPPPASPSIERFAVTPDPGVLEVNLPPRESARAYEKLMAQVFEAALASGLTSEKYLIDGRQQGSGGGHHLTFGGPAPLESIFVKRPDVLASLITFAQHHPSLSYLFTGLFVGPTSQAPRADDARHDALCELEIALERAFAPQEGEPSPWLSDMLFRNLLVDVTGNTHRAEISIDKLFSPHGAHGRQGLVELRAFEMPPHPRMAVAQALLVRSLLAAFVDAPYKRELVRWGQRLTDEFLLPHYLWRDFEDVLAFLGSRGIALPDAAYRPFLELRCPVVGTMQTREVMLTVRNALEPWHVLGEEPSGAGTSRFVDSSVERIELKVDGFVPERHRLLVNGYDLPLRGTGRAGELVGGVRFRAWAPPHSLQPHLGIHHPIRVDVLDAWGERSLGACAYHVWHPEGQGFDAPPLTRFEASARRAQRFTIEGPLAHPVSPKPTRAHPSAPCTLDLRRYPGDRPPPEPEPEPEPEPKP